MLGPPRLHSVDRLLHPGESLVLFTDGVTEARRSDGEFYGEDRLRECLRRTHGSSAESVAEAVRDEAIDFQDGVSRDDIAVLVLRRPR